MEKIERLEAELEALKIVCMSLLRRVDGFTWSEVRHLAAASATKVAEWRQSQTWTDEQLGLVELAVDSLTGSELPEWQTPLLPSSIPVPDELPRPRVRIGAGLPLSAASSVRCRLRSRLTQSVLQR